MNVYLVPLTDTDGMPYIQRVTANSMKDAEHKLANLLREQFHSDIVDDQELFQYLDEKYYVAVGEIYLIDEFN